MLHPRRFKKVGLLSPSAFLHPQPFMTRIRMLSGSICSQSAQRPLPKSNLKYAIKHFVKPPNVAPSSVVTSCSPAAVRFPHFQNRLKMTINIEKKPVWAPMPAAVETPPLAAVCSKMPIPEIKSPKIHANVSKTASCYIHTKFPVTKHGMVITTGCPFCKHP